VGRTRQAAAVQGSALGRRARSSGSEKRSRSRDWGCWRNPAMHARHPRPWWGGPLNRDPVPRRRGPALYRSQGTARRGRLRLDGIDANDAGGQRLPFLAEGARTGSVDWPVWPTSAGPPARETTGVGLCRLRAGGGRCFNTDGEALRRLQGGGEHGGETWSSVEVDTEEPWHGRPWPPATACGVTPDRCHGFFAVRAQVAESHRGPSWPKAAGARSRCTNRRVGDPTAPFRSGQPSLARPGAAGRGPPRK